MSRDINKTKEWWILENTTPKAPFFFPEASFVSNEAVLNEGWRKKERLYTEAEAKELLGNSEGFKNGDEVIYEGYTMQFVGIEPKRKETAILITLSEQIVRAPIECLSKPPSPEEIKEKEHHAILYWLGGKDAMSITGLSVRAGELHAQGIRVIDGELKRVD